MAFSPMMQHYLATKEQYNDCILFYRLGDFYEMFFDDAVLVSKELELTLTSKACGEDDKAPMCGVPYHAAETYIGRLIEKGYKVAIAEQVEDPALAKGLVERKVVKVVTPGTVIDSSMLNEKDNNYLLALYFDTNNIDIAWCDISTGEFCTSSISKDNNCEALFEVITRIEPKEIITNITKDKEEALWQYIERNNKIFISTIRNNLFYEKTAASMILMYLKDTQKQDIEHLEPLKIINTNGSMKLDRATIRNLEITETLFEKTVNGSLLGVLDKCGTAMGSRKMKQWLRQPLIDKIEIQKRQDAVEVLVDDIITRNNIRDALKAIYDLERLIARLNLGSANARDLIALKVSLSRIPDIKNELSTSSSVLLKELNSNIDTLTDIYNAISAAIVDEPPFSIREGGLIKSGYSEELDNIIESVADSKKWISNLEALEKERTGIKTLKVGFNKVFGYYIEISKSLVSQAPANYVRKQTLVNGERFITPELKEAENIVLNAQTKINDLEYRLFNDLRLFILQKTSIIQKTSNALSCIDVLSSFAEVSSKLGYVKPSITDEDEIIIEKGRHPVIETTISDGNFISNDVYLNKRDSSMLLITGPNMSGKSTYMRQTALIVLMAQAGCFVPAQRAIIGVCDRIYTRIGASDNIAMGQSTFFVEMSELAYILNTATNKSLIILDEIGRGTSTYDGLSIAWAVVEYLTKQGKQIRTLFATHYHELTILADCIVGVKNLNVDVTEKNGNIVFLHKIVEGSASRSYGIHVAKLAGVPKKVLDDANAKLLELESGESITLLQKSTEQTDTQMSLFNHNDSVLVQKIKNIDLMNITPSKAIEILENLKQEADNE